MSWILFSKISVEFGSKSINKQIFYLQEKALLVTERISGIRELKIVDGFTIINNAPEKEGRSYEPLSSDLEERKRQVSARLSERAGRLLENTDLEVSVSAFDEAEEARSVGEGNSWKYF